MDETQIDYKFAVWNVESVRRDQGRAHVSSLLRRQGVQLACLTETKIPGIVRHDNWHFGFRFCGIGSEFGGPRAKNGVGFVFGHLVLVDQFEPISDRLCFAVVQPLNQGGSQPFVLLGVYAPTASAPSTEVNQFYCDLQEAFERVRKKHPKLLAYIVGDFNVNLGSDVVDQRVASRSHLAPRKTK